MHILLVNNHSKQIKNILRNLEGITTVDYTHLLDVDISTFDGVVLSGGGSYPVLGNEDVYKNELDLIQQINMPLLGVCLGFELIVHVFNEQLKQIENKKTVAMLFVVTNRMSY